MDVHLWLNWKIDRGAKIERKDDMDKNRSKNFPITVPNSPKKEININWKDVNNRSYSTDHTPDLLDQALKCSDYYLAIALEKYQENQKEQAKHAEERIHLGLREVCENCGNPIPPARLKVMPTATRCVKCQSEKERKYSYAWWLFSFLDGYFLENLLANIIVISDNMFKMIVDKFLIYHQAKLLSMEQQYYFGEDFELSEETLIEWQKDLFYEKLLINYIKHIAGKLKKLT